MTRNRTVATVVAIVVFIAIGGYVAYDQFLRGDAAPALALPSAAPSGATASSATTGTPVTVATAPGAWTIASGSEAGYRVREQLANLPAESDAVGRTDAVTGSATSPRPAIRCS